MKTLSRLNEDQPECLQPDREKIPGDFLPCRRVQYSKGRDPNQGRSLCHQFQNLKKPWLERNIWSQRRQGLGRTLRLTDSSADQKRELRYDGAGAEGNQTTLPLFRCLPGFNMEKVGKYLENEELREQIKTCGIGTSATRAGIIKKLQDIGYININAKTRIVTPPQSQRRDHRGTGSSVGQRTLKPGSISKLIKRTG